MKRTFYILILLLFSVSACRKADVPLDKAPLQSVSFGFETSLEDWVDLGGSGERAYEGDIAFTTDTMSEGMQSCRFTVSTASMVAGGNRAELTFDHNGCEGDTTWFAYSVLVPENYPDVSLKATDGRSHWQIMGQWHQRPVFEDGETWDNPIASGPPPLAVYYNYLSRTDSGYLELLQDPELANIHGANPNWDEVATVSILYGDRAIAIDTIRKGAWFRLAFSIHWSEGNDGSIQVWKDGKALTDGRVYGPNMVNRASHYFKFGLYRHPDILPTQVVYYDDVVVK